MSSLRKPTIGPIVGHTTDRSCRVWIGSGDPKDSQSEADSARRTIGVIGVVKKNGSGIEPSSIYYFRLKRSYDRTGTFNLGVDTGLYSLSGSSSAPIPYVLKASTKYRVRLAVLTLDDAFADDHTVGDDVLAKRLPDPSTWDEVLSDYDDAYEEAEFKTFPVSPAQGPAKKPVSFLMGSCRYPGILWKRKHADRIFGPMLKDHADTVNFVLMVGDQIYADLLNRHVPIGLADTYEEFQERYHSAFSSRNMSSLLAKVPTYMILDDHEIEDNWTQDRIAKMKSRKLFNLAIGAYMSYQWSHGPRTWDNCCPPGSNPSHIDECLHNPAVPLLYYDFLCRGYPFFAMDMRTQRYKQCDGLEDNHLLGFPALDPSEPGQMERMLHWLTHQQETRGNTPKFIISASVFVPNPISTVRGDKQKDASDSWPAYPTTRRTLLDHIVSASESGIENVIFLCGDVHNFNIAQMNFSGGPSQPTAFSITSSGFYWPFPFADGEPSHFVHDSKAKGSEDTFALTSGNGVMDYRAWGFSQADNFSRIDIDPEKAELVVKPMSKDGAPLRTKKRTGAINTSPHRLKLKPW